MNRYVRFALAVLASLVIALLLAAFDLVPVALAE
jgi:hypothetical protein